MAHLKRSIGISLWFMFLTLPLMVVRVNTINNEVEWRWSNMLWVGLCSFALAWLWHFSTERRANRREADKTAAQPTVEKVTFAQRLADDPVLSKRLLLVAAAVGLVFPWLVSTGQNFYHVNVMVSALIFVVLGLGLNITVGLAGLLDLGYIAFLGAGAFTAATMSQSAFATIGWKPPFIVVMLIAGVVSATLGLIIGSPTLRVSGDYLAIVTLAFGEIFRITMSNLDGSDGPDLVHGSSGIPAIPNLNLFGFDFGAVHTVAGIPLGRFSNYFFLMLLIMAVIVLVFTRLNHSRIGRGWVAIREDEKAAEAMGVNVFGLKLLAFAGGAFLAGFAGAVKAHVDVSVIPDQYVFLESAFLLAAVVLGGMGTVMGVILGATLLKLLPEKLRFVSEYRMLMFGLLMVFMMIWRPQGLLPMTRPHLELKK